MRKVVTIPRPAADSASHSSHDEFSAMVFEEPNSAAALPKPKYLFHKSGQKRSIRFDGEEGEFDDTLGARYVHELLGRPNTAIPAIELRGSVASGDDGGISGSEQREALRDCHNRLAELTAEIEDAGRNRLTPPPDLEIERREILAEVRHRTRGKRRGATEGDPQEAARKAVGNAIRAFRKVCKENGMPKFAKHIARPTLKGEGKAFAYRPSDPAPDWEF